MSKEPETGTNECPFCHSTNIISERYVPPYHYGCADCDAQGPQAGSDRLALQLWNSASRLGGIK